MNKYIFPGADASCALNWVIGRVSPSYLVEFLHFTPVIQNYSLKVLVSRSNLLMSLVSTTQLLSGGGTRTGS